MSETIPRCQRNIRCSIRVGITLLAVTVCAYQIYIVCLLYYKYPTTVDIEMDSSPYVSLPAITVCSEISSTILVEELVKIKPSLYDAFAGKTRTQIALMLKKRQLRKILIESLHSLPINEQHNMTVSTEKFFKKCQLPTPLGRYIMNQTQSHSTLSLYQKWGLQSYNKINCTQLAPVLETISHEFKCFTLFLNHSIHHNKDKNYQIPKDVVFNLKNLVWIELNRDFMFNGLIYIHPPDTPHQHSSTSNVQQLDPDKHQSVSVAFERQIIKQLPPPYATNCHDYREDGYACRDECLTQCKAGLYLALDGWPGDVFANKSVTQQISKLWSNEWSSSGHLEEGLDATSLATCSYKCGHNDDCESEIYDVRTVRVHERDEDDRQESHSFTIGILPPKNLNVINTHVPKFQPIEFLVYIGSLVSLFLGISVVSFGVNVISFLTFSSKMQTRLCSSCNKQTGVAKSDLTVEDKTIFHNLQ